MHKARIHHHQRNASAEIYGERLEAGDIINSGDVYDCTDGTWRSCHPYVHGTPIVEGSEIVVVRPSPVLILGRVTA